MADVKMMVFDIIAKDNAGKTFHKLGNEVDSAGKKTSNFRKVAAAGLVAVGAAAVAFGKKSVDAYQNAAKESSILARQTGLTIKQSSQLRFAAEETGVEFKTLATSTKLFGKNLSATDGNTKKTADMVKQLGFNFKDAHGQLLPMSDLLPKVADRFKSMPDGPQKTALALKLFGRSGVDMIKMLNKGSEGLKDFAKESDKTGNTIKNTDSYKKNIQAQREFHAAVRGLMVTIGSLLMPVITGLSVYMTEHVAPAFTSVSEFVKKHQDLIKALVPVVVALVAAFVGFKILRSITTGFAALNAVMIANPIGLVVVAIAALAAGLVYAYKHSATFRKIVQDTFKGVGLAASDMWNKVIKPVLRFLVNTWLTVVGAIVNGAARAFGWVPGLGGKLRAAATWFNDFKKKVNAALDGTKDKKKISITAPGAGTVISQLATIKRYMHDITTAKPVKAPVQNLAGMFPGHNALGTRSWSGGDTVVGEGGAEIIRPPAGSQIIPAAQSARMLRGGGGGGVVINVNGALDPNAVAAQIEKMLARLSRQRGAPLQFATR